MGAQDLPCTLLHPPASPGVWLMSPNGILLLFILTWFPGRRNPHRTFKLKMTYLPPPWLDHTGPLEKVKVSST